MNKNSTAHSPQIKKYFRCPRFKLAAEVKELASNTAVRSNQFYCTRDPIELQQHYDQKGNNVSSRLRNPTVLYQNKIQHHPNQPLPRSPSPSSGSIQFDCYKEPTTVGKLKHYSNTSRNHKGRTHEHEMREKSSAVENTSRKTGKKKTQGHHHQDQNRKIQVKKSQEEVLNQYASQTESYDTEFESQIRHGKKSVIVSDLNFDKVQKGRMVDIMETNFNFRNSQAILKDTE